MMPQKIASTNALQRWSPIFADMDACARSISVTSIPVTAVSRANLVRCTSPAMAAAPTALASSVKKVSAR